MPESTNPSERPTEEPEKSHISVITEPDDETSIMVMLSSKVRRDADAVVSDESDAGQPKRGRRGKKPALERTEKPEQNPLAGLLRRMVSERIPFVNSTPLGGILLAKPIEMGELCLRLQRMTPVDFDGVAMIMLQRFNWLTISWRVIERLTALLQEADGSEHGREKIYEEIGGILRQLVSFPADLKGLSGSSGGAAADNLTMPLHAETRRKIGHRSEG